MHLYPSHAAVSEDVTETRPMCCAHVGLDCPTCVKQSALKVSTLCAHLSPEQQTTVFFQLYRDRVCRTNVKRFRREYEQLTENDGTEQVPDVAPDLALA